METTVSQPPLPITQPREPTARKVGLVMTYNQRETCVEAINSLLVQTLALDLIIVSDDCSTDGTYEVITNYFSKNDKPSNVELYQSDKNLGFIPHFNTLLKNHCRDDDLIFYNAGDDISETSRVEEFYREYVTKGKPRHFLGHSYVTSFGSGTEEILVPPIESIKENRELCLIASAYHIGASQVFTGALFFDFGPILFDDCYEDLTLGYRALLKDAYHFIPKALLRYRVGGLSSWQKNPLEKKRGRLRSTLTQRAIDSLRSGDFEALATIQDCYSQYGFSHRPHHNKVRIIVVSDEAPDSRQYAYSIADHFHIIHNVCELEFQTSARFLASPRDLLSSRMGPPDLVWVAASRIAPRYLREILSGAVILTETKLVVDLGLIPSLRNIFPNLVISDIAQRVIADLSNISIHTANLHLHTELTRYPELFHATYLYPLQSIDGPDPILQHREEKRGLAVVIGADIETDKALHAFVKANEVKGLGISQLHVCKVNNLMIYELIASENSHGEDSTLTREKIDVSKYDYIAIISGKSDENYASLHYWWSIGARYFLPMFVNSEAPRRSELVHGSNCLFVNSNISSWSSALELVRTRFDALQSIASNSRQDVYFKFSIQKNVKIVSDLIALHCRTNKLFDKFLPL